ncbi:ribonuclease R family protein [Helicobacter sp. 13S00477-4]|uniref:RNB domain-containing ribonuclease n=1 Tax=Helicobacter sp. 13S00477-4 TaxID=1905759 RepID=UPI000BA53E65|nr:ribonuclease R family protein [Helicobacter sp. 13S00477-4]PAF52226.1 hypothetical protein BKH44_03745 [Helicobacter sp. 13S00477-4]
MREFYLRLAYGMKSIPRKYKQITDDFKRKGFVKKIDEVYCFSKGYLVGSIDISRGGRVFLCPFGNDKKDFILNGLPKNVFQNDIVLVRLIKNRGKVKAKFVKLLHTQNSKILCYLKKIKGEILAIELKNPRKRPIRLNISKKSLLELPRFCVVSVDLSSKTIQEVIGPLEDALIDEKISLFGRVQDFSFEAKLLADSFGQEVDSKMYPNRLDLTHLPFFTIDPDDAKDHDDAIYFDSTASELYIAIADVSEYVSTECCLDIEARHRGFSVYLPHKSYPMLPPNLSENICSLKEGKTRLAFVWHLRLHKRSNEVIRASLFEALICNHQNISYTKVNSLFEGKKISLDSRVEKSIRDFLPIAQRLRSKRLKKGYEFFNDEIKLKLNNKGMLEKINVLDEGKSHIIVEEAMLLANQEAAKLLDTHLEKGIYRIHQKPSESRMNELLFDLKSIGFMIQNTKDIHHCIESIQKQAKKKNMLKQIDRMIIKAQSQASYSPDNIGHFGLGFKAYSHFTSPIRRYSDLILHRILKEIVTDSKDSGRLAYLLRNLSFYCSLLNEQEREISKIEIDFKDRKYARWAQEHIKTRLQAVVIDENYPPIANALTTITGARLFMMDLDVEVNKLDVVDVEIMDAEVATGRIFVKALKKMDIECIEKN